MKRLAIFLALWCSPAIADAPKVVADIAPVHSLVAMVMDGVGEPVLLLDASSDPHGGALRPSQARALGGADVVVWMGAGLTPWLAETVARGEATSLALLDWPGTATLPLREEFGGHDHGEHEHEEAGHEKREDDEHGHEDHGHDEHEEHAHEEKAEEKHEHGDEIIDPHAWLDPMNAMLWLAEIATVLGKIDPLNTAQYAENARAGMAALKAPTTEAREMLASAQDTPFAVEHDAFQYFENWFGLTVAAAHSAGDGDRPGPQRMRSLLARLGEGDIRCLFAEVGPSSRLLSRVPDGVQVVKLDPLGAGLEPGAGLYPALIRGMATDMAGCLSR